MTEWALDTDSRTPARLNRVGWTIFIHMGKSRSWGEGLQWCIERIGEYTTEDGLNNGWSPHGFNSRIAIRDPNEAFEFRMRFC